MLNLFAKLLRDETGATAMESLYREKLLQPVNSPAFADLAPAAIRPHREWIGTRYNIFVAAYNTGLINKADLPKDYDDLADRNRDALGRAQNAIEPAGWR